MPRSRVLQTSTFLLTAVVELMLGLGLIASAQAQFKPPDLGGPRTTAGGGTRFKPPNRGAPAHTAGGATRVNTCSTEKTPLTAIVPSSKFGLTTESHPTFFVYLPKTNAPLAELALKDADERDIYRTTIPLAGRSGLVSVQLPADAPALEVGKYYQWYFSVICQPSDRLRDDFVMAWVKRVQPNQALAKQLQAATDRQRPGLYGEAGIWQDMLAVLAMLRQANPTDATLIKDWNSLLESVDLGQIVKAAGDAPVTPLPVKTQQPR